MEFERQKDWKRRSKPDVTRSQKTTVLGIVDTTEVSVDFVRPVALKISGKSILKFEFSRYKGWRYGKS